MTAIHEFKSNFFTILTHTRIKSIMCQLGYEKGYENHIMFGFSVRNLIQKDTDLVLAVYQNTKAPAPINLYHDLVASFGKTLDHMNKGDREDVSNDRRREITLHSFRRFVKTTVSGNLSNATTTANTPVGKQHQTTSMSSSSSMPFIESQQPSSSNPSTTDYDGFSTGLRDGK